ncbi:MAG: RNase adapter RapZ [Lachnospiraceae bacterium]|nr:RNase adapter RapZ [Lachnospiraceae bacterium]MBQ6661667.1 RNase adapter RapZ [Lachnospiraceae bacterium]
MALVIITGLSGAGKSVAINALEDMGYYCVDNLPAKFLVSFADLYGMTENKEEKKIATVVDIRGKDTFGDFYQAMEELSRRKYPYHVMFLDCDTQVLIQRYKFTRRRHPLMEDSNLSMEDAIALEREWMKNIRVKSDYLIDTTTVKAAQLREKIMKILSAEPESDSMLIRTLSFGFKEGIASDADLVFDVRCLPNPYYIEELKNHTGLEDCVRDYIMSFPESRELLERIIELVTFLLPLYRKEGKRELVVAFGCTGGRHRSVCFAQALAAHMAAKGQRVIVSHRELERE